MKSLPIPLLAAALLTPIPLTLQAADPITLNIDAHAAGKPISPDLVGIFFEDLNYAADGGLYAELIQNRSFEYSPLSRREWHNLTSWELVPRGGRGSLSPEGAFPLHSNNPHYAVLEHFDPGELAIINAGYDGIVVREGESYNFSFFARHLYTGGRWDAHKSTAPLPLVLRLETPTGLVLAETSFSIGVPEWVRFNATLTPSATANDARLVLVARERGGMALDEVSLFPAKTFLNRPNGLRADIAQTIADLKPKFVRFPGGCLVHGNGLPNLYNWKDTIGPVEQRRQQPNLWGYHQSVGLGYFEYFQFCEDIGAKPLPVLPAAVSCQNSGHTGGTGQQCLPLERMPEFIQDVLDLIEYANGPVSSKWGAKRAAAGHPAPFGLKYLGVGNEDAITPGFRERFRLIHDALRAKHPEITIIGTSGPAPDGPDFEQGWAFAGELKLPMVDEHYYKPPQWFWENLTRYDTYDRTKSQVYLGEYAAHDAKRRSTLRAALAEAACLTSLERNGDVVAMASYAPLLAKRGHTQWSPDLIYFNNTAVFPTLSYEVQRLFSIHSGDTYLPTTPVSNTTHPDFAASTVRDSRTGDVIVKLVNGAPSSRAIRIELAGADALMPTAAMTVLSASDASVANEDGQPPAAVPAVSDLKVTPTLELPLAENSLTIIRIKKR